MVGATAMRMDTLEQPMSAGLAAVTYSFSPLVTMLADPGGPQAEAVRTLRTHIMAQHIDDGRRGLAVCAASADVGCTFTAVNLAVALSQIGLKTLLVDGDLRKPGVDGFIAPSQPQQGLLQYLTNAAGVAAGDVIQDDVLPGFSVMFAGGASADAQELLASDRFGLLIDHCLRDYDVTIVDTPPANRCADARRISTVIGYSVIVARRHQSLISDVKVLAAQLREDRARVVGTVMNEG